MNQLMKVYKMGLPALVLAAFMLAASATHASGIRFVIDDPAAQPLADNLAATINQNLPDTASEDRLAGIGNAVGASQAGIGVNHAPGPKIFIIGTGLSLGLNLGEGSMSDLSTDPTLVRGIGYQTGLMAGVNLGIIPGLPSLGPIDLKKIRLYGNYFSASVPAFVENLTGLGGSFKSIGFHLQYQVINDINLVAVSWAGLRFTTGFTNTKSDFYVTKDFTETATDGTFDITWDGTAKLGNDVSITTIPFEFSTGVKVAVLSFFGGVGLDLHMGNVESKLTVSGPVDVFTAGTNTKVATGDAFLEGVTGVSPDKMGIRMFGGVQFNIMVLKLLAQVNADLLTNSNSFFVGARVAF